MDKAVVVMCWHKWTKYLMVHICRVGIINHKYSKYKCDRCGKIKTYRTCIVCNEEIKKEKYKPEYRDCCSHSCCKEYYG